LSGFGLGGSGEGGFGSSGLIYSGSYPLEKQNSLQLDPSLKSSPASYG